MEIKNGEYTVYYHQNKINGKIYVGITKRKLNERFGTNGSGYTHCVRFYNAIQKYGWNNFYHEIFASNLTKEEACNIENVLIQKLKTNDRKYGYNICDGGGLPPVMKGENNPFYGNHTMSGINHPMYGKKHNEETRLKMSQNHYNAAGVNNPNAKKVKCIETGKIYDCVLYAQEDTGIKRNNITAACRKDRQETAGGFHWEYVA